MIVWLSTVPEGSRAIPLLFKEGLGVVDRDGDAEADYPRTASSGGVGGVGRDANADAPPLASPLARRGVVLMQQRGVESGTRMLENEVTFGLLGVLRLRDVHLGAAP